MWHLMIIQPPTCAYSTIYMYAFPPTVHSTYKVPTTRRSPANSHLYGWFLQVSQIGRGLSWLLSQCLGTRVRQSEGINHHLACTHGRIISHTHTHKQANVGDSQLGHIPQNQGWGAIVSRQIHEVGPRALTMHFQLWCTRCGIRHGYLIYVSSA